LEIQLADHNSMKKNILFSNGNRAQLLTPPYGTPVVAILKSLDIEQPKALIVLVGGASGLNESLKPRLNRLFSRGIAHAIADSNAMIMDGGTQAGVMEMMGQGIAGSFSGSN